MKEESKKPGLATSFVRSQVAAFIATVVDYLTVIFLTEVGQIWYVYSTAIGAATGAILNFLLGRYWVFESTESKMRSQAIRYIIVSLGSLILNTVGVYLLTESSGIDYKISKIIIGILVGVFYNFYFQKKFVYKD